MTPELKSPTGASGCTRPDPRPDTTRPPQDTTSPTEQQTLFQPPPLPREDAAIRALLVAFGSMLLTGGTGTLSDSRRWLDDPGILGAIKPSRFGTLPRRFGKAIRARDVGRAQHAGSGSHFCLVYTVTDTDRLRGLVEALRKEGNA